MKLSYYLAPIYFAGAVSAAIHAYQGLESENANFPKNPASDVNRNFSLDALISGILIFQGLKALQPENKPIENF